MTRPAISILINNYNYGHFIGRAIESALAQKGQNAEIIVVDDGSTDQSRAILEPYRHRLTLLFQENKGQAAAINAAVKASAGDILCFLDADDWWAPEKLASISAAFDTDTQLSLVYHRLQPAFSDGTPTLKPIPRTLCSGDLSLRLSKSAGCWPFPMTSAIAVRRSTWDAAGDIPEQFRISADFWLAGIYPFLGRVAALPSSLGFYRIHENTWYRSVDDAAMLRKRMSHWIATVDVMNKFLSSNNLPATLRLADHYPYRVALAQMEGGNFRTRFHLAMQGIAFAGEPNLMRRMRDALRAAYNLPSRGKKLQWAEEAQ